MNPEFHYCISVYKRDTVPTVNHQLLLSQLTPISPFTLDLSNTSVIMMPAGNDSPTRANNIDEETVATAAAGAAADAAAAAGAAAAAAAAAATGVGAAAAAAGDGAGAAGAANHHRWS